MKPRSHSLLSLQECADKQLWFEVKRRWSFAQNCGLKHHVKLFLDQWLSINLTQTPGSVTIGAVTLTAVVIEDVPHVMTELGALTLPEAFGSDWIPSPGEIERHALAIRERW